MKKLLLLGCLIMCISACTKQEERVNPFFEAWEAPYEIPPFDKITIEDYREAMLKGIEENKQEIEAIVSNTEEPTFENVIIAYDRSGRLLMKVAGVFYEQSNSNGTDEMKDLETELQPLMTDLSTSIMLNKDLFAKIKTVKENTDLSTLGDEEKMLLEEVYSSFIRGGALLEGEKAERFKELSQKIGNLQNKFGQNLAKETEAYQLIITKEEDLAGLPEDAIATAALRAKDAGKEDQWIFGLENPSIMPFLFYADNRELRTEIMTAYLNRCNNNNREDNKQVIIDLVMARKEMAELLGHKDFAHYALEKRMAKTPDAVYTLLDQIWMSALHKATEERDEMQKMIGDEFKLATADWRYYSEKLKHQKYDLSDEMLRPYFKASNVRDGIFWVCNKLYGITFKAVDLPKPHKDIETFVCYDNDGTTELGVLFLDLYARPGFKRGGAWCGTYRDAYTNEEGKRVIPQTYIVCNFTSPIGDAPALFTPDEVETFFHEFGHALHNLFKINKYHNTSDVPRDFVELPSQIMEHWAFEPEVLKEYAKHYETGEVIPTELVEKVQAAGKYGQGFATTEFLAAALLDMDYHVYENPADIDVINFEATTLGKRGLISEIPPRYRSTYFQHTFTGGYAAGYYSYTWSEVLDCDAYEAFVETGDIFNREVAESFRRNILQQGGIYPADQMYSNFRGKQPSVDGLLKNRGLMKMIKMSGNRVMFTSDF